MKSLDGKKINDAQKKLDWGIESLGLSIKCMVINYKDEKHRVQFFTWENKLIRGVGFSIPEKWVEDTNPRNDNIHDELKSFLIELEQKARREMRELE